LNSVPLSPEITLGRGPFSKAPAHFFAGRIWVSLGTNRELTVKKEGIVSWKGEADKLFDSEPIHLKDKDTPK
jgi:hypothetical protein